MRTTPADSRKPVVIRFPEPMRTAIETHQAQMSASMGGSPVFFTSAVLHLIQTSLDATAAQTSESN